MQILPLIGNAFVNKVNRHPLLHHYRKFTINLFTKLGRSQITHGMPRPISSLHARAGRSMKTINEVKRVGDDVNDDRQRNGLRIQFIEMEFFPRGRKMVTAFALPVSENFGKPFGERRRIKVLDSCFKFHEF